ncbi:SdiA-regulated domain-containing protein [uncultured Formosa sp.]|uniref:SdiA-regulated domain-containing protein n=1 Tax=uncultured Formosa sp. TaxID=255435 RepID=UPI002604121D|nr:SdiA-regulated domain-containing protein [uncultured Formosa sp.]
MTCKNPKSEINSSIYHLNEPSRVWEMPKKLVEISGISVLNFPNILSVNDEEGKLYAYNLETKTVEDTYKFGKDGDYEDLVVVDDVIYVLKSNGTIYEINNFNKKPKVKKYKTFLSEKEDTEGLYFDKERNRLLIACKEEVKINNETKNVIYAFNLDTNTLNKTPAYSISKQDFKFQNKKHHFAPSGLAINPKTNTLFIISSVGKLMVEMNLDGDILNKYSLDYPLFKQPEGIFFSENGDLYISNEGRKGKGNILKFDYIK